MWGWWGNLLPPSRDLTLGMQHRMWPCRAGESTWDSGLQFPCWEYITLFLSVVLGKQRAPASGFALPQHRDGKGRTATPSVALRRTHFAVRVNICLEANPKSISQAPHAGIMLEPPMFPVSPSLYHQPQRLLDLLC